MKLLTAIKNFKNRIDEIKNKLENERLTQELENRKNDLRRENINETLDTMAKYLAADMLERTGLLYSLNDIYIQTETQRLFWEWKQEGIIDEFDNLTDETKEWILEYK